MEFSPPPSEIHEVEPSNEELSEKFKNVILSRRHFQEAERAASTDLNIHFTNRNFLREIIVARASAGQREEVLQVIQKLEPLNKARVFIEISLHDLDAGRNVDEELISEAITLTENSEFSHYISQYDGNKAENFARLGLLMHKMGNDPTNFFNYSVEESNKLNGYDSGLDYEPTPTPKFPAKFVLIDAMIKSGQKDEALKIATSLKNEKEYVQESANLQIITSLLDMGQIDDALALAKTPERLLPIIEKQVADDLDTTQSTEILNSFSTDSAVSQKKLLINCYLELGKIDKAVEIANRLYDASFSSNAFTKSSIFLNAAIINVKKGKDWKHILDAADSLEINNEEDQDRILDIKKDAQVIIKLLTDEQPDKSDVLKLNNNKIEEIAQSWIKQGKYQYARDILPIIPLSGRSRAKILSNLATAEYQNSINTQQEMPDANAIFSVAQKSDDFTVLEGIGFTEALDPAHLSRLPHAKQTAILLGEAEHDLIATPDASSTTLNSARIEAEENIASTKVFVSELTNFASYEQASNQFFALLNSLNPHFENHEDAQSMRILKGLIELNNPKAQTFATRLFTDERLPVRYKDYLAHKLIAKNYWDGKLGELLKANLVDRQEQYKVFSVMIREFGLTPDLPTFGILEQPGFLKSPTLEERVQELKELKERFNTLTRDELLELFHKDKDALSVFYITNVGEYRYSVINDYSQEKFKMITDKVHSLEIHDGKLEEFTDFLLNNNLSVEEVNSIIEDAKNGKPLIKGDKRVFQFSTAVEFGSQKEEALARLQTVWKNELVSLLACKSLDESPETVTESLQIYEQNPHAQLPQTLINRLRINNDKFFLTDINAISKDMGNTLRQKYKSLKDKEQILKLNEASTSDVIVEFLKQYMPDSPATSEWQSHLRETLSVLESAPDRQQITRTKTTELELTFLDKTEDFVRAIRFADAAQCCFNASNENIAARSLEYPTRLNKDPLSFIMDIKEPGAKEIIGFVFGRMGVSPETKRPIIMLNGIYSQLKGSVMNDNILKIIEEQMGGRLHAEGIAIASSHGGTIDTPTGYQKVNSLPLTAIRALGNYGEPETRTYDDIGDVANGDFNFTGYYKKLDNNRPD